jgi:uncharacterized protein (TIGR03083 family)
LEWLRENYAVALDVSSHELALQVADCPGWCIDDVVDHLGRSAIAFAIWMTSQPDANPMPQILCAMPAHLRGEAAVSFARRTLDELLVVVADLDPHTACPFISGPGDVAAWLWHAAAETWVHRTDIERVLGRPVLLDPDRGADGLHWAALIRGLIAARHSGGPPAAVRCVARDAGEVVDVGEGAPVATVAGRAGDLMLRLWKRQHGHLDGDGDAVSAWADLRVLSPLD